MYEWLTFKCLRIYFLTKLSFFFVDTNGVEKSLTRSLIIDYKKQYNWCCYHLLKSELVVIKLSFELNSISLEKEWNENFRLINEIEISHVQLISQHQSSTTVVMIIIPYESLSQYLCMRRGISGFTASCDCSFKSPHSFSWLNNIIIKHKLLYKSNHITKS